MEAAGTVVKDGRAASADALPRGRHGRTPRPGAAYAGWHGRDGRRGKKAGHRRHITANNDHHRPKLRRSTGEVRLHKTLYLFTWKWKYLGWRGGGGGGEIITLWFGSRLPLNESNYAHRSAVTARKRKKDPKNLSRLVVNSLQKLFCHFFKVIYRNYKWLRGYMRLTRGCVLAVEHWGTSVKVSLLPCYKGAYIVILCYNNMLQIPFYSLH